MNRIVLHIPHNSVNIPLNKLNQYTDLELLDNNISELTDFHTEDLFSKNDYDKIVFEYSRFFCDVERFYDDDLEPMSKKGMGVIYKKGVLNDEIIRRDLDENEIEEIKGIYNKHHNSVREILLKTENPFLVDCHSFSNKVFKNGGALTEYLPDFCIGFNSNTNQILVQKIYNHLSNLGYIVGLNEPFNGSLYYEDIKMNSIMIEVNKKLYLNNDNTKKIDFYKTQNTINNVLKIIENFVE